MRLCSISSLKLTCLMTAVSLLTACGFHLRGDYLVPHELNTLSMTSYDQYSTFTRLVQSQLRLNHVTVVPPAENIPNLELLKESIGERTLSLYQNTRAAEKELTFRSSYRVTIPDIGSKTFTTSVTRSYLDNPLTALAKSVERDIIEDEMRKLAASQIIRQMARLKVDIQNHQMDDEDNSTNAKALSPETNDSNDDYHIMTMEAEPIQDPQPTATSEQEPTIQSENP